MIELDCRDIREFAINAYGQVDDKVYGGGTGMLMLAEPILKAWLSLFVDDPQFFLKKHEGGHSKAEWQTLIRSVSQTRTIYLSPKGRVFNQSLARELAEEDELVFICGHYEGVDQRVLDVLDVEEVSLGDFVLTGGEIAVVTMIDAISRLVPGVLPNAEAYTRESHTSHYLEEPQYSRPSDWRGLKVPEVLLSGHQSKIDAFRQSQRIEETLAKRPDIMDPASLSEEDWLNFIDYLTEQVGEE